MFRWHYAYFGLPLPIIHSFKRINSGVFFRFDSLFLSFNHETGQTNIGRFRCIRSHDGYNFTLEHIKSVKQAHQLFRLFLQHIGNPIGQCCNKVILRIDRFLCQIEWASDELCRLLNYFILFHRHKGTGMQRTHTVNPSIKIQANQILLSYFCRCKYYIMKQFTIQNQVTVKGVGLHTGKSVVLTFKPAEANHGYRFQRTDLEDQPVIPADVKYVYSTNRGTTLKIGDAQVSTVEHVLSALVGLGIDNVLLEIDGPEMPIMDGTAKPFADALKEAGLVELDTERDYYEITEPISYKDEVTGTEIMALPSDHFEATVMIDFNSSVLGQQFAALSDLNDFETEIAPCRTFVFLHELEKLLDMGLIKGGALDNAIVIADRKMEPEDLENLSKKLNRPNLDIDPQGGVLNTIKLHFQNEPARHKLLDVIGDLALVGKPIKGKIVATKPGHTANTEFAKILKKDMLEKRKLMGIPKYDPEKEPVLDINGVSKMLPHRYPFLLVDKIIEISSTHVIGIKNVTINEAFFQGHFPDNPVFPGVLQIEALAQTGGILALYSQPDQGNWDTYFLKIDNTKFKAKVMPGDTMILKMELIEPIRRGIVHMQGTIYVGNKIVSEGELTAQIVRRAKPAPEEQK